MYTFYTHEEEYANRPNELAKDMLLLFLPHSFYSSSHIFPSSAPLGPLSCRCLIHPDSLQATPGSESTWHKVQHNNYQEGGSENLKDTNP